MTTIDRPVRGRVPAALLALVALAATLVALLPTSAHAASKAQLKAQAYTIMNYDYHTFHNFKTRQHPRPFNWSDDGCSVPKSIAALSPAAFAAARAYAVVFDWPCEKHDFGYRNYGGRGLALDRSEKARAWIDWHLLVDTQRACDNTYRGKPVRRSACRAASRTFYGAVHKFGRGAFTG